MDEAVYKNYRESTHYMEKMRIMIAKGELKEWSSVFLSYAKKVERRMKEIIEEVSYYQ